MFKGCTPTFYYSLEEIEDLTTIVEALFVIKSSNVTIEKYLSNSELILDEENKLIYVELSQEETLSLKAPNAMIQLKILLNDDKTLFSEKDKISIENSLSNKILKAPETEDEDEGNTENDNTENQDQAENTEDNLITDNDIQEIIE